MSTTTPNLGLALQPLDAPGWDVPLNNDLTLIDSVVGGGVAGRVLTSNGPNSAPTYQTVSAPPGGVTSVGLSAPGEFAVSGSPVTSAGTLAITKTTQSANTLWAGPAAGAAAQPAFRALVPADLPFPFFPQLPSGANLVPGNLFAGVEGGTHQNTTLFVLISGACLQPNANFKLILNVVKQTFFTGIVTIGQMAILQTLISKAAVLSSTPVTIGGSGTPAIAVPVGSTQNAPQVITTDTINIALDQSHDYYFACYFSNVGDNAFWDMSNCPSSMLPSFFSGTGNAVVSSTIPTPASWGTGAAGKFVSRVIVP